MRLRLAHALAAVTLSVSLSTLGSAQTGTIVFSGVTPTNGAIATASFTGPALTFTPLLRTGFGNTSVISSSGPARWWQSPQFSGQSMVYGNTSTTGAVLELLLSAGTDPLTLTGATFGGLIGATRRIGYRFFSADFTSSSALFVATPGTTTPDIELFTQSFGSQIRLQFTEVDANNNAIGQGPNSVGIQNINYSVASPTVVPEPSTTVLLLAGGAALLIAARRRVS